VVKCLFNIATDTLAIVSTSLELNEQIDENEKTAALIELLKDFKTNCEIYTEQILTYYDTIRTELNEYKNSNNPTSRAAHSTIVASTNALLIDLISQNC
jgi:type IV secretory pathway TrbF-like protein